MSRVTVKVNIDPSKLTDRAVDDKAKLFMASTAYKLMFDYIPADTLILASTVNFPHDGKRLSAQQAINAGESGGNIRIENKVSFILLNLMHIEYIRGKMRFRTDIHHLATANWDKVMVRSRGDKLREAIQNYFDKR